MNIKVLILSTVVGILTTSFIFLIADVVWGYLPDSAGVIIIALFIGSTCHLLVRNLMNKSSENSHL
ncbi:hypothetical protein DXF93_26495 [Escherichia coli]|nr:hypothetical protein DXF93_26495 [Escherichia coli]HCI5391117.1 hypothetical protein [Klebsiella pneumoniae]